MTKFIWSWLEGSKVGYSALILLALSVQLSETQARPNISFSSFLPCARLTSHCVSVVPPGVVSVIAYEHEFAKAPMSLLV